MRSASASRFWNSVSADTAKSTTSAGRGDSGGQLGERELHAEPPGEPDETQKDLDGIACGASASSGALDRRNHRLGVPALEARVLERDPPRERLHRLRWTEDHLSFQDGAVALRGLRLSPAAEQTLVLRHQGTGARTERRRRSRGPR